MAENLLPGPVVDGEWLAANHHLVAVADVRWSFECGPKVDDYRKGHIPGAVFVDLDTELSDPPGSHGRHPLPPVGRFLSFLEATGRDSIPVVCYDDVGGGIAARLWWMLDALGFSAAVLDGGVAAWPGELESSTDHTSPHKDITARPVAGAPTEWPIETVVEVDGVVAAVTGAHTRIIDARSAGRFAGLPNDVDKPPGHMPGAHSRPWQSNLDQHGRFLPPTELRAQFEQLGVNGEQDWIATCGSGVTACHNLLAARIAGLQGGKLYVGSWSEWTNDVERPIARSQSEG